VLEQLFLAAAAMRISLKGAQGNKQQIYTIQKERKILMGFFIITKRAKKQKKQRMSGEDVFANLIFLLGFVRSLGTVDGGVATIPF